MKRLILVLAMLVGSAWGQATFYQLPSPHPNAVIRVCPVGTANPCPSPSAIFNDAGLSQTVANPFSIGPTGQFGFWIAAGQYTIQLASPDYTVSYVVSLGGGGGTSGGALSPTNFGAKFNTKFVPDASTFSNSHVTCPNTPCNFTQADVGKIIFGMTGPASVKSVLSLPQGIITAVNSANDITVSSTATATVSGNEVLLWGTDDTAALKATEAAALATCPVPQVILPAGMAMIQKGFMVTNLVAPCSTSVTAAAIVTGYQVAGQGPGVSFLVGTPNFDFSSGSCPLKTNVPVQGCFFTAPGVGEVSNITIWGGGNDLVGQNFTNQAIVAVTLDTHLRQFSVIGWGGNSNGLIGAYVGGGSGNLLTSDNNWNQVVVDGGGSVGIEVDAPSTGFYNVVSANNATQNLYVTVNGVLNAHGGFFGPSGGTFSNNIVVDGTANFFGTTNLVSNGNLYYARKNSFLNLFGDSPLVGSSSCIRVGQGSQVFAAGTQCGATTTLVLESGGLYVDGGGNKYTNGVSQPVVSQTVQGTPVGSGTTATAQLTGVPGGTFIVAYTIFGPSGNTIAGGGCTDTFGTTLTQLGTTQTTTTTNGTAVQFAVFTGTTNQSIANLGANDLVTCNYTGSVSAPGAVVTALYIVGQDPVQVDQSVNGSGNTTSVTAGPLTTNYPNELMLLVGGQNISSATFTHGTNYVTNNQGTFLFAENGLFATNTATTATGTEATVGDWVAKLIAIKPNFSAVTQQLSASRTAQVAANIALTSGWGTSVVSKVTGNGVIGNFTITNSVTGGASPVLTVTFPTNFLVPPSCTLTQTGGTFRLSNPTFVPTISSVAITFTGTPTSPDVYNFRMECD